MNIIKLNLGYVSLPLNAPTCNVKYAHRKVISLDISINRYSPNPDGLTLNKVFWQNI